jgi:hypothetical protein
MARQSLKASITRMKAQVIRDRSRQTKLTALEGS